MSVVGKIMKGDGVVFVGVVIIIRKMKEREVKMRNFEKLMNVMLVIDFKKIAMFVWIFPVAKANKNKRAFGDKIIAFRAASKFIANMTKKEWMFGGGKMKHAMTKEMINNGEDFKEIGRKS